MQSAVAADTGRAELATTLEQLGTFVIRRLMPTADQSLSTMAALATLVRSGPSRITDLAASEALTQPAMTALVNRLERRGLAAREKDPTDGRAVLVRATEAGHRLIAERRAERARRLTERLAALPPEDEAALIAAAPALRRLVEP